MAEGGDGLLDRSPDGVRIGGIRLNRYGLSTSTFNFLHDRSGRIRALGISKRDACAIGCRPLGNRYANPLC
jgi:hypothetical protein